MTLLSSQHAFVRRAPARWRVAFAALAFTALWQGCATGPGESENTCEAGIDADGDGASGCKDSDCHRFELCRLTSGPGGDTSPTGGSSGQAGSGGSTEPTGGMSGGMVGPGGSGGSDEMEDGGVEPDASECSCAIDEVCIDDRCEAVEPLQPRYFIEIDSATSPIGLPGPPPHGLCVEIACREPGAGSPVGFCPCEPEPYVRVVHISSPGLDPVETVVLTTKVQGTALSVAFDDTERVEVPLVLGDALRFELWDDNVTTADSYIYSCDAMLGELATKPLECKVFSGAFASEEFAITGSLTVL